MYLHSHILYYSFRAYLILAYRTSRFCLLLNSRKSKTSFDFLLWKFCFLELDFLFSTVEFYVLRAPVNLVYLNEFSKLWDSFVLNLKFNKTYWLSVITLTRC
uniref:Uncharacterized protein n=1 Tax=Cacopsylla melanoneura TaxID=428564 RepID=A0A8D8QJT6_9HEMI